MLVWFDALTAKQARIASVLALEGEGRGYRFIVTCRKYDYVINVLKMYGVNGYCEGEHGEDVRSKLVNGLSRSLKLINVVDDFNVHISLTSPDAFRVAFGLGKPSIALTDTAHAFHVNKLTLPLADRVIAPIAIPKRKLMTYIPHGEEGKVKFFNGVFEVMWVYRFKPNWSEVEQLGLRNGDKYVVFRFEESKAAYYKYSEQSRIAVKAIRFLLKQGFKVIVFPRYDDQRELVASKFNRELSNGNVIIPSKPVDGLQLAYFSSLVITGGSTFAVEAALLGVPSISYFPSTYYTDKYVIKAGAPLIRVKPSRLISSIRKAMEIGKVGLIKDFEDPTGLILNEADALANEHRG
ncbi:DUF354 domain-containing protein [Caldivirga sp.]|uniref:DUF354 domain-containing protein n=1 Tax=Caldivirga sp. TaxID=2080243 RepID=UPI003D10BB87